MKISEIKELTVKELLARRHELRQEVFNLRIQQQSGQLERPHMLTQLRKDLARIETMLTQKQKSAAPAQA
jgi:large subunit ribosomal protein L29